LATPTPSEGEAAAETDAAAETEASAEAEAAAEPELEAAPEPARSGRWPVRWIAAAAAIGVACALFAVLVKLGDPEAPPRRAAPAGGRPAHPPGPNDPKPAMPPGPKLPALSAREKVQLAEQVRGSKQPGRDAFRAVSERYVDENLELARGQAKAEGITLPEVRELTYFGLMVLATQRFEDVEAVTGRQLNPEQRGALADLMQSANNGFREAMRGLVARGGGEEERWRLIRDTEARYEAELFRLSGLDEMLLDDLLAGNLALPGAPAAGEVPEGPRVGEPRDVPTAPPRPAQP